MDNNFFIYYFEYNLTEIEYISHSYHSFLSVNTVLKIKMLFIRPRKKFYINRFIRKQRQLLVLPKHPLAKAEITVFLNTVTISIRKVFFFIQCVSEKNLDLLCNKNKEKFANLLFLYCSNPRTQPLARIEQKWSSLIFLKCIHIFITTTQKS